MPITSQFTKQDAGKIFRGDENTFVPLPFGNLRVNWNNGSPHSQTNDARRFGGWQCGKDKAEEDLETLELGSLPTGFSEQTWVSDKGSEYQAYSSRAIYAAPIVAKDDWWEEYDNKRGMSVKRHRLDFLVYLASIDESKKLQPWGPAVLSATGYAASAILKSFKSWIRDTTDIRGSVAGGVPEMFFYIPIGTFGDTRLQEPAGSSVYVPCQYKTAEGEWTEKRLAALFVGDATAALMLELQAESEEWTEDTHANRSKNFEEPRPLSEDDINAALSETDNFPF